MDQDNLPADVLESIRAIVGSQYVSTEAEKLTTYGKDWTSFLGPKPSAVVFPRSTDQMSRLVRLANQHGIKLVPSGGRTGLSGGAVAAFGEVVVSLDKLNKVFSLNVVDQTLHCGAGMITAEAQAIAAENELYYPVDFASSGSSQIGGNVATNAGGIKVIKYGMTRQWVVGLTVVTGAGEVLNLRRGLVKDNSGYDLMQLFIGSEGTLGIITEVTLQLTAQPVDSSVMVLGLEKLSDVVDLLVTLRGALDLSAFEFFSDKALSKVEEHLGLGRPFIESALFYVLIEFENPNGINDEKAEAVFEACLEHGWINNGVISRSLKQKKDLWCLREGISEAIATYVPYKNDISVRPSSIPAFVQEVELLVEKSYPDFSVIWFGHIGDGNLHLNILKPTDMDRELFDCQCGEVSKQVFQVVQKFEGSVSAEHGVGLLKKEGLSYCRSDLEIALMKGIKTVFDPNGLMNPGKVFS